MTTETVLFAIFYTALLIPVAVYYYLAGRETGVRETVYVFHLFEPEALVRIHPKLKEIVNGTNAN